MKKVTRKQVDDELAQHRPHLESYEAPNGNKGVYRRDAGPATSFQTKGKTWREVLDWLTGKEK
jgi:hypothetical protein